MDEKNLQSHCAHDSRGDDPRHSDPLSVGNITVFFVIPTKTVLNSLSGASFIFFYELYFLSCALILGVSREKSYCRDADASEKRADIRTD